MTDPKTLVENEYVSLWYHADAKVVHHQIHKPIGSAPFRDVLMKGLACFEEHRAHKWLSDDRANGPLNAEDGGWAQEVWSPRVVKAGWKYWAIVMPKSVMGTLTMKPFVDRYAGMGVTVRLFDDPGAAFTWLQGVD